MALTKPLEAYIPGIPAGVTVALADLGVVDASATVKGVVELATSAECTTGTDTVRAVTPAGLKAVADTKLTTGTPAVFVADPTGGTTTDAEARAAIASILDVLIAKGLMAAS